MGFTYERLVKQQQQHFTKVANILKGRAFVTTPAHSGQLVRYLFAKLASAENRESLVIAPEAWGLHDVSGGEVFRRGVFVDFLRNIDQEKFLLPIMLRNNNFSGLCITKKVVNEGSSKAALMLELKYIDPKGKNTEFDQSSQDLTEIKVKLTHILHECSETNPELEEKNYQIGNAYNLSCEQQITDCDCGFITAQNLLDLAAGKPEFTCPNYQSDPEMAIEKIARLRGEFVDSEIMGEGNVADYLAREMLEMLKDQRYEKVSDYIKSNTLEQFHEDGFEEYIEILHQIKMFFEEGISVQEILEPIRQNFEQYFSLFSKLEQKVIFVPYSETSFFDVDAKLTLFSNPEIEEGDKYYAQKNSRKALECYLAADQDLALTAVKLQWTYAHLRQHNKNVEYTRKVNTNMSKHEQNSIEYYQQANEFARREKYEEAASLFLMAAQECEEIYLTLLYMNENIQRPMNIKEIEDLKKKIAEVCYMHGAMLQNWVASEKQQNLEKQELLYDALRAYNTSLSYNSKSDVTWQCKGTVLFLLDRFEEAFESYDKAIKINNSNALAWNGKAKVYKEWGKYELALICCDICIDKDPEDVPCKYLKGNCHGILRQYEEAIAAYKSIPKSSSYYKTALEHIASIKVLLGDCAGAYQDFHEAYEKYQDENNFTKKFSCLRDMIFCAILIKKPFKEIQHYFQELLDNIELVDEDWLEMFGKALYPYDQDLAIEFFRKITKKSIEDIQKEAQLCHAQENYHLEIITLTEAVTVARVREKQDKILEILQARAIAFDKIKDINSARADYQKILEYDSNSEIANNYLFQNDEQEKIDDNGSYINSVNKNLNNDFSKITNDSYLKDMATEALNELNLKVSNQEDKSSARIMHEDRTSQPEHEEERETIEILKKEYSLPKKFIEACKTYLDKFNKAKYNLFPSKEQKQKLKANLDEVCEISKNSSEIEEELVFLLDLIMGIGQIEFIYPYYCIAKDTKSEIPQDIINLLSNYSNGKSLFPQFYDESRELIGEENNA